MPFGQIDPYNLILNFLLPILSTEKKNYWVGQGLGCPGSEWM